MRRLQQMLAGLVALISLMALFFAVLRWRVETPEDHLVEGPVVFGVIDAQPPAGKQQ